MQKQSELIIVTNDNKIIKENIISLIAESSEGRFEILPNHTKSIISTIPTVTTITTIDGNKKSFFTSTGILYINNNLIRFCCDSINFNYEIDLDRAKLSEERAKNRLMIKDGVDIERAKVSLLRARARIEINRI